MSYLGLLWAGLFRRKTRTALTLLSIVVAFLLFALLRTVVEGLDGGVSVAGADRLVTSPRYSIVDPLPMSHEQRIKNVPGVLAATHANWFGGIYQDPANFFPKYPVDPRSWFEMYPEYRIPKDQLEAFENSRTGAVAPKQLADEFNWKIGDRIPIEADIWPKNDGTRLWEFDLVGIYEGQPGDRAPDTLLFRSDYFNEARQFANDTAGWFIVRIADPAQAAEVARNIDALFANSPNETRTATEQEFQASFAKQIGDIGLMMTGILSAVFFTILLLTGNTMSQAFRERIPEVAVLKTLGFSNGSILVLLLGEAMLLAILAAVIGMALALLLAPGIREALGNFLPVFEVSMQTLLAGVLLAALLGFVTGALPAWQGMRLTIVEALRRG